MSQQAACRDQQKLLQPAGQAEKKQQIRKSQMSRHSHGGGNGRECSAGTPGTGALQTPAKAARSNADGPAGDLGTC